MSDIITQQFGGVPVTAAEEHNNPGNLRVPGKSDWQHFDTPEAGFEGLVKDLEAKRSGKTTTGLHGGSTLYDFTNAYAPKNDPLDVTHVNKPEIYAQNIAKHLGVTPETTIGQLNARDMAAAVANQEDHNYWATIKDRVMKPDWVTAQFGGTPIDEPDKLTSVPAAGGQTSYFKPERVPPMPPRRIPPGLQTQPDPGKIEPKDTFLPGANAWLKQRYPNVYSGVESLMTAIPRGATQAAKGAMDPDLKPAERVSNVIEGTATGLAPTMLAVPGSGNALRVGKGLVGAAIGQQAGSRAAEAMGAEPETQRAVGDVAGLIGGAAATRSLPTRTPRAPGTPSPSQDIFTMKDIPGAIFRPKKKLFEVGGRIYNRLTSQAEAPAEATAKRNPVPGVRWNPQAPEPKPNPVPGLRWNEPPPEPRANPVPGIRWNELPPEIPANPVPGIKWNTPPEPPPAGTPAPGLRWNAPPAPPPAGTPAPPIQYPTREVIPQEPGTPPPPIQYPKRETAAPAPRRNPTPPVRWNKPVEEKPEVKVEPKVEPKVAAPVAATAKPDAAAAAKALADEMGVTRIEAPDTGAGKERGITRSRATAADRVMDSLRGKGVTPKSFKTLSPEVQSQIRESIKQSGRSKEVINAILDKLEPKEMALGGVIQTISAQKPKVGRRSRRGIWYGPPPVPARRKI